MVNFRTLYLVKNIFLFASVFILIPLLLSCGMTNSYSPSDLSYRNKETREVMELAIDAAGLIEKKGEKAFDDFREPGSRWRKGVHYIFVTDTEGIMHVNIDPSLEGRNQLDLKDVNGKPLVRGMINTVTTFPDKKEGWYHYEWFIPGAFLPQWKSSYIKLAESPSGKSYVVGCGTYDESIERAFVVDNVNQAIRYIEEIGPRAFRLFKDPAERFMFKDSYIFVLDMEGNVLVNAAFPNLEGRNLITMKDAKGKEPIREMIEVVREKGSGWVDYMWPQPGDSASTLKTAYVGKAMMGDQPLVVGSGVYLADAPKEESVKEKMTATELMNLVNKAAALLEKRGEDAYSELAQKGSMWLHDDTYIFVWDTEGKRLFYPPDPDSVGRNMSGLKDNVGRPIGRMIINTAKSSAGEGWIHYMYPEPGNIFPTWKSTFIKRVTFPSDGKRIIGSGIYNMEMDESFIEDVVNRAAALVSEKGRDAFDEFRDKTGPFVFMDTYVFVNSPEGVELVNPAQPSLEGKNIIRVKDLRGKPLVRDYINAAMENGSAWVRYYWYKPGENMPAQKKTYVRKVEYGDEIFIVGSGFYPDD